MQRFRRLWSLQALNRRLCWGALAATLLAASVAEAQQLPSAALTTVFPPGGKQGSTFDVSVAGIDLDDCEKLVFSHPGITATCKTAAVDPILGEPRPASGQFSVSIAPETPPGLYEVRALGRYGLSNPRAFVVGKAPEVVEAGANNEFASASPVEFGAVVNGRCDAGASDYFKIALKAGQRLLADASAWRIDSKLSPVLSLYDTKNVLLRQSQREGAGDALLDFVVVADGEYILKIHDFVFDGGPDYFYRLELGSGPIVESVFPPAAQPGVATSFTFLGRNLPGGQPAPGLTIGDEPLEQLVVTVTPPADSSAGAVAQRLEARQALTDGFVHVLETAAGPTRGVFIGIAETAPVIEQDPNDGAPQAQKVSAPVDVAARFYPARDRDWFTFDAKAGDVYWIEVVSHRSGVNTDPYFTIETVSRNEKGEEVVAFVTEVDDPAERANSAGSPLDLTSNDPSYRLEVGADATYRIMVRDLAGDARRDARSTYRLLIRKARPDFRLVITPTDPSTPANPNAAGLGAITLRRGQAVTADVFVERMDGFAGDVEISVEGLPAGVSCPPTVISANLKSSSLVFSAAENAAAWAGPVRVVGKAQIQGADAVRTARASSLVWGSGNLQAEDAQSRLTSELTLAVLDKETAPASITLGEPGKLFETSRGGTVDIPVKIARRGEYKAEVALVPFGLPNDLKPQNVSIKPEAADGTLQVVVNNTNVPAGVYTFRLQADSKLSYARNPEAVARAEEDQKKVDAAIADRTEKNRLAQEAKTAAETAAANTAAAVQTAQQAKTAADDEARKAAEAVATAAPDAKANAEAQSKAAQEKAAAADKALADSQAAAKSAEEAKAAAEKAAAEADAALKQAQNLKTVVDKQVADAKAAAAPKEVNIRLVSTPITLRIAPTPIKFSVSAPAAPVKQGEKSELLVKVEKLYGFNDQIDFTLEPPATASGLSGAVSIPKDQGEAKLEVVAAADAAPGEHAVVVRARLKFNNINLESTETVPVKVEKVEPAK